LRVTTAVMESAPEVPRRSLALLARRVLRGEEGDLDVSIVLADDATLRSLNHEYRNLDRTTDVLSFNIPATPPDVREGGEVYISLPQARRQARRLRHSLVSELERLVIHGVLHLLGHDHKNPAEAQRMRARENAYMRARSV